MNIHSTITDAAYDVARVRADFPILATEKGAMASFPVFEPKLR